MRCNATAALALRSGESTCNRKSKNVALTTDLRARARHHRQILSARLVTWLPNKGLSSFSAGFKNKVFSLRTCFSALLDGSEHKSFNKFAGNRFPSILNSSEQPHDSPFPSFLKSLAAMSLCLHFCQRATLPVAPAKSIFVGGEEAGCQCLPSQPLLSPQYP